MQMLKVVFWVQAFGAMGISRCVAFRSSAVQMAAEQKSNQ
jgi:hypothetical protein